MKIGRWFFVSLLVTSATVMAVDVVDSSFLGEYKLISSEKGECSEAVLIKTKEREKYSLWITYRDENNLFAGNEKFEDINDSLITSNGPCPTAGPVLPLCVLSKKEITKYNKEKMILENFFGSKKTFSKAKYKYTKLDLEGQSLTVTQLKLEKPMPPGVFTLTPLESGATNTAYYTFATVNENSVCVYDKQ
ncbi:MAG: hypothetical protein NXH75_01600 [Halobacteriovoraceae bacterium]|nr:hypothetical protein [Halobacteriovoraceae bacterium]